MGLNYRDSIVVYNRITDGVLGNEYYIGKQYDNVRVELTEGANIVSSGLESINTIVAKIPMDNVKNFVGTAKWNTLSTAEKLLADAFTPDSIMAICKKPELNIDITLPVGTVLSDSYDRGFLNYLKSTYGYTYAIKTIDIYMMIPRVELGGR